MTGNELDHLYSKTHATDNAGLLKRKQELEAIPKDIRLTAEHIELEMIVNAIDDRARAQKVNRALMKRVMRLLRAAHMLDPEATAALVKTTVLCNEGLADHSTIVCGIHGPEEGIWSLSPLGLLNGLSESEENRILAIFKPGTLELEGFALHGDYFQATEQVKQEQEQPKL